jgi:hypothetical protein
MNAFTNHHLTVEHVNDKSGPAVMLTQQEGIEDTETIIIHPWQLVAACEHLGLTASDPKVAKDIATLQRRMLALRDRIDNLTDWMEKFSDHNHADLSYEMTQLTRCKTWPVSGAMSLTTTRPLCLHPHYPRWTVTSRLRADLHRPPKLRCFK